MASVPNPARFQSWTLADVERRRGESRSLYEEFLRVPSMNAGLYALAAGTSDPQKPHAEDELYYVVRGRALFEADGHDSGPLGAALAALRRRSERLAPIVAELRAAERAGQLTVPLADLAPSFLHVHANRLLRTVPRPLELILYELLGRLYESRLARTRGADAVTSTAG